MFNNMVVLFLNRSDLNIIGHVQYYRTPMILLEDHAGS